MRAMTHPKLFAASNVLDVKTHVSFPTIGKKAMAEWVRRETISEEMRVLYVAMTRPKERLIMTYCSTYLESELKSIAQETRAKVSPDFARHAKNPGYWVLMAAMNRTEAGELFALGGQPRETAVCDHPWHIKHHETVTIGAPVHVAEAEQDGGITLPSSERLATEFAYTYPHLDATELPTKLTPTQLKGRVLDGEVLEQAEQALPAGTKPLRRPRFVTEQGLTATEKGTANHLFLQFARYENCTTMEAVTQETQRLVAGEYLTLQQGEAVIASQIVALFQSDFGQGILNAPRVVREFKFSLLVDAKDFGYDAQEKIMLQGVVDCLLVSPEGLTIIDFKTDWVNPGKETEKAQKYTPQVEAYGLALSKIYKLPVVKKSIYFLKTGTAVYL